MVDLHQTGQLALSNKQHQNWRSYVPQKKLQTDKIGQN
jgi:hypothetical protein